MSTDPTPQASAPRVVIRYPNLSGALVEVLAHPKRLLSDPAPGYSAHCAGCLDFRGTQLPFHDIDQPRAWAAKHAAACRALPQPTHTDQPGGTK